MIEPQGFVGTTDYIKSVIQEDGFYLVVFATPTPKIEGVEAHYQFTVEHNIPDNAISSFMFHVAGHLFNGIQPTVREESEGEPK
jgi:hypothetical protein